MRRFKTIFFAWLIVGLFNTPARAQAQTDSTLFYFPLDVGNVWVYRDWNFPSCGVQSFCVYERLEVVSVQRQVESTCATLEHINDWRVYNSLGNIETINYRIDDAIICQAENRIYAYEDALDLQDGFLDKYMIADFDRDESQPWQIAYDPNHDSTHPYILRRLIDTEINNAPEFYFGSYRATQPTDLVGVDTYYLGIDKYAFFKFGIGISRLSTSILFAYSLNGNVTGDTTFVYPTSIDDVLHPERSEGPALLGAYPNPFNPSTVVSYRLSVGAHGDAPLHVLIHVVNQLGQRVATLYNGIQTPGQHSVTFDAAGLPSGMYVILLETNSVRDVRKVTLVK